MKGWVFSTPSGGLENTLKLRNDLQLPPTAKALKSDQVLVKTLAVSLNPVDYKIGESPLMSRLLIKKPSSPGLDFSGTVVALGANSGKFKHQLEPGMMVLGRLGWPQQFGPLGEYVVCGRDEAVAAPSGMSAEDAAAIGTAGLTAIQSIQPYVREGSNVFINGGSGGVGLFGIQIAKVLGCSVTVTCSSANVDLCKSVGADKVIDYRTSNVVEELAKSEPKYDLFLDYVGTRGLYWAMGKYTNPDARCVQVATDTTPADIFDAVQRFLIPSFIAGPGRKLTYLFCQNDPENFARVGQWVKEGKVKVITDQVFAYEDAPKAFARLKTHRARGKVVISSA